MASEKYEDLTSGEKFWVAMDEDLSGRGMSASSLVSAAAGIGAGIATYQGIESLPYFDQTHRSEDIQADIDALEQNRATAKQFIHDAQQNNVELPQTVSDVPATYTLQIEVLQSSLPESSHESTEELATTFGSLVVGAVVFYQGFKLFRMQALKAEKRSDHRAWERRQAEQG